MERHSVNQFHLPQSGHTSYIKVLNSIFAGCKGYESNGSEEDCIQRTRKIFEAASKKYKAPVIVPIIFRNSSERGAFLDGVRKKQNIRARNPPDESPYSFNFAEDIFSNIIINFSKEYPSGKQKPYILLDNTTKFVCLKKEFCPEDAFKETFSRNPSYYADDIEEMKKSQYVEPNVDQWKSEEGCTALYSKVDDNEIKFLVDFSIIYPENIFSTALVICCDCGRLAETTLCDSVKQAIAKEMLHNIIILRRTDYYKTPREDHCCVMRLPITNSLHSVCSFREGLVGFTNLPDNGSKKPSNFVRIRITFYTNEESRIGFVLHGHKSD